MATRLNEYLIEQLFSMDEEEIPKFIARLKPETREYLDIILAKAEKNVHVLKKFMDAK
jgi:DNA-directed RNA polymerase subunit F